MTSTARTTEAESESAGHRMTLLGVGRDEGVAYIAEELTPLDAPIVYRMFIRGPRSGHLVPIHAWYETNEPASVIRARIDKLAASLEQCTKTTAEAFMLSTRIVQRRALRIAGQEAPIRKFALQLRLEPVSGVGANGHTTVTAFLRPEAKLNEVWAIPGETSVLARVSFTGVPSGLGLSKDTFVLLTE